MQYASIAGTENDLKMNTASNDEWDSCFFLFVATVYYSRQGLTGLLVAVDCTLPSV